ncbi:MAG: nickel pincer cofactor biosynthesis protein LarB [Planctomycetota bacterium]
MRPDALERLLRDVRAGRLPIAGALVKLRALPFTDLGFATVDTHRAIRCGLPEVVFCLNKTPVMTAGIARTLAATGNNVLLTRATAAHYRAVSRRLPKARWHAIARAITITRKPVRPARPGILIITAGTADLPAAEEARVTAEIMGNRVRAIHDVGVAGIHRLLRHVEMIQSARVLVVAAGMEGALPSVVGGLVARPVIALPTSIGYGASFGGVAALLAMLNSCAAGVSVVNIDNGFGAGYLAGLINSAAATMRS